MSYSRKEDGYFYIFCLYICSWLPPLVKPTRGVIERTIEISLIYGRWTQINFTLLEPAALHFLFLSNRASSTFAFRRDSKTSKVTGSLLTLPVSIKNGSHSLSLLGEARTTNDLFFCICTNRNIRRVEMFVIDKSTCVIEWLIKVRLPPTTQLP